MPTVIYPDSIRTGEERLKADYSLIEQARLFHNEIAAQARESWPRYKGQWLAFAKIYHNKIRWLLHEQNIYKEKIRLARFPRLEAWRELSDIDYDGLKQEMYGDKASWKLEATRARSPLLDKLRAIDLSRLDPLNPPDPFENPSTYTESDTNGVLSQTTTRSTWTNMDTDESAFLYKAGTWDGDFEHLMETQTAAGNRYGHATFWQLANVTEDFQALIDNSRDALIAYWYGRTTSTHDMRLVEMVAGTRYVDDTLDIAESFSWYPKIKRDEAVGTFGTLYLYLYDAAAQQPGDLDTTLTLTLHEKEDFTRFFLASSRNQANGGVNSTGWVQDVDLQEVAPPAGIPVQAFMHYQRMRRA